MLNTGLWVILESIPGLPAQAAAQRLPPERIVYPYQEGITMSKIFTAADQLIGHTPLLELTHIEKEQQLPAHILAKLE